MKPLARTVVLVLVLVGAVFGTAGAAHACLCVPTGLDRDVHTTEAVFVGTTGDPGATRTACPCATRHVR